MSSAYRPARWLPNPHAMTVYGRAVRLSQRLPIRRERWELADGDFLDVDRLEGPAASSPIVVVLHGLEGSSRASYVRGVMAEARARGLGSWALNFRGCSGELNRLPRFYHSGETGDLAHVVERAVAERPGRAIGLIGFSLGGNVVAKYLGERGNSVPAEVRGAAVVSVPFDLGLCARALDGDGLPARVYRGIFLHSLRGKALVKGAAHPAALDWGRAAQARTFAEFDGWVTAPLHGFASADDYWDRCSSGPLLPGVRRPLLAIAAADDPFVPTGSWPSALGAGVSLETTEQGGHLAFIAGPPWAPVRWAERRAVEFVAQQLL